jgi:hypothetical protein
VGLCIPQQHARQLLHGFRLPFLHKLLIGPFLALLLLLVVILLLTA